MTHPYARPVGAVASECPKSLHTLANIIMWVFESYFSNCNPTSYLNVIFVLISGPVRA